MWHLQCHFLYFVSSNTALSISMEYYSHQFHCYATAPSFCTQCHITLFLYGTVFLLASTLFLYAMPQHLVLYGTTFLYAMPPHHLSVQHALSVCTFFQYTMLQHPLSVCNAISLYLSMQCQALSICNATEPAPCFCKECLSTLPPHSIYTALLLSSGRWHTRLLWHNIIHK